MVLSVVSLFAGAYWSIVFVTWQPLALSLGASMALIGLLESFGGRVGIITTLVQPFGGWLSDRRGRKIFIVFGSIQTIVALTLYAFASYMRDWRLLVPASFALGLVALGYPALDSTIAESVEIQKRGMAFSVIIFFTILPGIFTSMIGGFVADRFGYLTIFLISLLIEALNLGLIVLFVKETLHQASEKRESVKLKKFLRRVLIPKLELRGFYLAMAVDIFSWSLGATILYGLLSKTYHFSNLQLGILSSIFYISWTASQLPVGKLIERYGCKKLLILSEVLGIIAMVGWLTFSSFEALAFIQIFYGLAPPTWDPAMKTLLANSISEDERAEEVGKLGAFRGIIGFSAPFIGGVLYDAMGMSAPILAGLIGVIIALVLILLFVREPAG